MHEIQPISQNLFKKKYSELRKKEIKFNLYGSWSHRDIPENKRADRDALDAIDSTTSLTVNNSTYSDTKNVTNTHMNNK